MNSCPVSSRYLSSTIRMVVALSIVAAVTPVASFGEEGDESTSWLRGRVTDAEGAPAAGATVTVVAPEPKLGEERRVATVAADGSYALPVETGEEVSVWIEHAGHAPALARDVGEDERADVRLEKGWFLLGRVRDVVTREPIAGARVTIVPAGPTRRRSPEPPDGPTAREVTTDSEGNFLVERVATGVYDVHAVAEGRAGAWRRAVRVVRDGAPVPAAELRLRPGRVVTGRVVDAEGSPVEGAKVEVRAGALDEDSMRMAGGGWWIGEYAWRGSTREDGTFEVEGVAELGSYLIDVLHPSFGPRWKTVRAGGSETEIDAGAIALPEGARLRIQLWQGEEIPFAGKIEARFEYRRDAGTARSRTHRVGDENLRLEGGELVLSGLPEEEGELTLRPAGFARLRIEDVRPGRGEPSDLGERDLAVPPLLNGVVRGDTGRPIAEAVVSLSFVNPGADAKTPDRSDWSRLSTDSAGRFAATIPEGAAEASIRVWKEEWVRHYDESVPLDGEPLAIVMESPGYVTGRAVTGDPPRPIPGVELRVHSVPLPGSDDDSRSFSEDSQEADGTFEIGVPQGEHTLVVSADGFVATRVEGVDVRTGEETAVGDVVLRRGIPVFGRVTERLSGQPVEGAYVERLRSRRGRVSRPAEGRESIRTDATGSFRIDGLEPGPHEIGIWSDRHAPRRASVEIRDGDDTGRVEILLDDGARLTGTVFDPRTGVPFPGAIVSAMTEAPQASESYAMTGADGGFAFEHLPVGKVRLTVRPTSAVPEALSETRYSDFEAVEVELAEGEERVVVVPEDSSSFRVAGTVVRDGKPVAARLVWSFPEDPSRGSVRGWSDEAGRYEVNLTTLGEYGVAVFPYENRAEREADGTQYRIEVDLDDETELGTVEIALQGAELLGRLLDATTGEALNEAFVVLVPAGGVAEWTNFRGMWASASREGYFQINGLQPGEHRVIVRAPGYVTVDETIELDEDESLDDAVFSLVPAPVHTVWIVDESGVPVSGATLSVTSTPLGGNGFFDERSDGNGRLVVDSLDGGVHPIVVTATGYAAVEDEIEILEDGSGSTRLVLSRGGALDLSVVDEEGRPVPGAALRILDDGGRDVSETVLRSLGRRFDPETGNDGRFEVPQILPGSYEVVASTGGVEGKAEADVATDSRAAVTIELDVPVDR